ncbi:MAG: glycine--tRNA ligase subunit beta, partial [Pseudomonadota bacterium]
IDEKPTGSKDPFALRRAALGVLRIVIEADLREPIFNIAIAAFNRHMGELERRDRALLLSETDLTAALADIDGDVVAAGTALIEARLETRAAEQEAQTGRSLVAMADLARFVDDRLKVLLRDRGIRHDVIDAVAGIAQRDVAAVRVRKARALQDFLGTEDGANLLAAYRRGANIVAAEEKKEPAEGGADFRALPDAAAAAEPAERALFDAMAGLAPRVEAAVAAEDFVAAMAAMAELRAPVDAFFDDVTVNAPDPALRLNRLRLLSGLRALMCRVAIWDAIEG